MKTLIAVCSFTLLCCSAALADTHYVDINNASPSAPYTNWGTAATVIQDTIAETTSGDTVLVADGVYDTGGAVTPGYSSMNRVVITNDIVVQSVNGPSNTFIVGKGPKGSTAVRGVYMSTGVLCGFTVTNGHTRPGWPPGYTEYDTYGGGVNLIGGNGTVTNCTLTGNSAFNGGGSNSGTFNHCTFLGNKADNHGGGSFRGTLNNCTLTGNSARWGAGGGGGGSASGTLNNCTLTGNSASNGGGSSHSTLNNCTLTGNSASNGGGSSRCTLNNCTLTGNSASNGGGSADDTLTNCTMVDNIATNYGGGSYDGSFYNCIVYSNTTLSVGENWYNGGALAFFNSCTTPDPGGAGNITNAPLFIGAGNYRLAPNSPCINAGSNAYVSTSTDLDGNPRIIDGTVDMGAYEAFFITDSHSSASGFALEWMTPATGWISVVRYSTNLVEMPFNSLAAPMEYPLHTFTDTVYGAKSECFYKVEMLPEPPEGMVLIPGGINEGTDPIWGPYLLSESAFYMDRHEVTGEQWNTVYNWALANGYNFISIFSSKAPDHPLHSVLWYDCVKWCNARSEMEGKTPCYTVSGSVYKTGIVEPDCDFNANGYRLPTAAEWEYAARGGTSSTLFPWGYYIQHNLANYFSQLGTFPWDVSPTTGYHPVYNDGVTPYTSPAGSFAPNGFGLFDVVGNIAEWCWDWYPGHEGTYKRTKGGAWSSDADTCRLQGNLVARPDGLSNVIGFRTVLPAN